MVLYFGVCDPLSVSGVDQSEGSPERAVVGTRGRHDLDLHADPATEPATGPTRTGGRGLLLVEALADRWGCAPRPDGPGKTVWAEYTVDTVARCAPSAAPS